MDRSFFSLVTFFSVTVLVINGNPIEDECHSKNVEKCAAAVKTMYGMEEIMFSSPEEQCMHAQEVLHCINLFVVRCLDDQHRTLYSDLTSGYRGFIEEFCNDKSEFSLEYRRHLPCYMNLTTKFQTCSEYVSSGEKKVERAKLESKNAAKVICCHYGQSVNCYHRVTLENCSEEAADLVNVIFHKLMSNITRMLQCEQYVHGDPSCSGVNSDRSLNHSPSGFILIIWFLSLSSSFFSHFFLLT